MVPDSFNYLQSLESVRDRCKLVFEQAKEGKAESFDVDLSKLGLASDYIVKLIERDYGPFNKATLAKIPPHGRWLHFGGDRLERLIAVVGPDQALQAILDLFVVAVLLDAGAGDKWKYNDDATKETFTRSEGLAVAAYYMFMRGLFSSDPANPFQVDSAGLAALTEAELAVGMQVSEDNPVVGLQGRFNLLKKLGAVLEDGSLPYFKGSKPRPSNFTAYLQTKAGSDNQVETDVLWEVVTRGFGAIWPPVGAQAEGRSLGDAWTANVAGQPTIIPFHKLSQWLTYSLMVPIQKLSPYRFINAQKMTGLPEYRNGGFFTDLGVLNLRAEAKAVGMASPEASKQDGVPAFHVHDQTIVEWRALTICLLDMVADDLRGRIGASADELTLPMVLEAGTWKAGRELAAQKRPANKNPPLSIISDGTVF